MTDHAELIERLRTELTGYEGLLIEAATALSALVAERDALRDELMRIEDNLGDYIERKGTVDVMIALAYETARAALAQGGEK